MSTISSPTPHPKASPNVQGNPIMNRMHAFMNSARAQYFALAALVGSVIAPAAIDQVTTSRRSDRPDLDPKIQVAQAKEIQSSMLQQLGVLNSAGGDESNFKILAAYKFIVNRLAAMSDADADTYVFDANKSWTKADAALRAIIEEKPEFGAKNIITIHESNDPASLRLRPNVASYAEACAPRLEDLISRTEDPIVRKEYEGLLGKLRAIH